MTDSSQSTDKKNVKLLIADDEVLFLNMLGEILKRSGYVPDLVSSGDMAVKNIESKRYDVILTDIRMPGATGLEVLNAAKKKDPDTQVIMISAYGDTENVIKALRFGANDFIQKPVEIPAIIPNIVERASEKRLLLIQNKELVNSLKGRTAELESALSTINKQQEQLVHDERLKVLGTMAAGMAHEINNPLAFISVNVQTLEKYLVKVREKLVEYGSDSDYMNWLESGFDGILNGVYRGVSRISQITMALRTFSRKGTGVHHDVSLKDCVDDALRIISPRLKGVKLVLNLAETEKTIKANQQNMVHAIMNFIQNACDAMEESEKRDLTITTVINEKEQTLIVSDTGSGIKEEDKKRIFELFYTTKPVGKGTGLGLSIAHGVIEESGGIIDIQSEFGNGTVVKVSWPGEIAADQKSDESETK